MTNRRVYYTLGLWPLQATIELVDIVSSTCICTFVAKYRRLVFTKEILEDLRAIFSDVYRDLEATLAEFDGEWDHVHALITYPPKVAISRLVNSLKGVSSRLIRKKYYPDIERALWGGNL